MGRQLTNSWQHSKDWLSELEKWIVCTFVAWLPQHSFRCRCEWILWHWISSVILVENHNPIDPIVTVVQGLCTDAVEPTADQSRANPVCYLCANPYHLGSVCIQGCATRMDNQVWHLYQRLKCFRCQRMGHFVSECLRKRIRGWGRGRPVLVSLLPLTQQVNIQALP